MTFDPNNFAAKNGQFIGLPYTESEARVVLLPVPWEATVSYHAGTALGPANILEASYQLDLVDWQVPNAWQIPIYWRAVDASVLQKSNRTRALSEAHIQQLETTQDYDTSRLEDINEACRQLNDWVYYQTKSILQNQQLVGLIGGEHSVPLGYLQALSEIHEDFGILQIDAHCDLRQAYEHLDYSHASIFYNALKQFPQITQLTQVGIRDACPAELEYAAHHAQRLQIFSMHSMRAAMYSGQYNYHQISQQIVDSLPSKVYISFDIDGLDPALCPGTGTPVPGGLQLEEAFYLIDSIRQSGRQIIGFDLCEVGSASEWDGNVGARVCYKLAVAMGAPV